MDVDAQLLPLTFYYKQTYSYFSSSFIHSLFYVILVVGLKRAPNSISP